MFAQSLLSIGKHHWSDIRFEGQIKSYMEEDLSFKNPKIKEIYSVGLLLYPVKGI